MNRQMVKRSTQHKGKSKRKLSASLPLSLLSFKSHFTLDTKIPKRHMQFIKLEV